MALVTVHAVVHIPTHIGVTKVVGIPASVTIRALEHGVVTRGGVAGCANAIRISVIHREVGVIESRARPCSGGMAGVASGRETGGLVIWIGRVVVVRLVATHAGRRQCRVIVVHVAVRTGHGGMRPGQRECGRIVIESRAGPVCGAMAHVARSREADLRVHRVIRVVVVGLVTGNTRGIGAGQGVVAIHVALGALQGSVRAGQRKSGGRMVEGAAPPVGRGMALIAGLGESRRNVIRIGGGLEILQVTLNAGATGQVISIVHVALRAGERSMRAGESKSGGRMVESS